MKRKRLTTEKLLAKHKAEGRGEGRGSDYKPGLRIQDVPSQGLATRVKGWKTNREHHLFSKLELHYFYILDWSFIVADIREQFPLDLDETLAIAKQLGIRHPTDPRTKHPIVMTSDFLITSRKAIGFQEVVRTVKYVKDLSSKRVMEKFEIERRYWENRSIDWGIVTEREINPSLASNVEWVHPYRTTDMLSPLTEETITQIEEELSPWVALRNMPLRELTDACDDRLNLPAGSSLMAVRHLIASKKWHTDMLRLIQVSKWLNVIVRPTENESTKGVLSR